MNTNKNESIINYNLKYIVEKPAKKVNKFVV